MNGTLRFGIIGCSWIAPYFADGLRSADGADLVACADIEPEIAEEFAVEHGDLEWYEDHERMIDASDLDAVCLCTPSGTHAEVAIDCARAGVDILCEKPFDVTMENVTVMIDACDEAGVTLGGIFQRRTHAASRRAKTAIETGELGTIVLATAHVNWHRTQDYYDGDEWRGTQNLDGGVLMNQAIHGVDLAQWLMGGIERVTAASRTLAHDIEVDDTAVVNLEYANGALGSIEATTGAYPERPLTVQVYGDEGSFVLDIDNDEFVTFETSSGSVDFQTRETEFGDAHGRQIQEFVDALKDGRPPAVTGREASNAVAAVLAMYESARESRTVELEEFARR